MPSPDPLSAGSLLDRTTPPGEPAAEVPAGIRKPLGGEGDRPVTYSWILPWLLAAAGFLTTLALLR